MISLPVKQLLKISVSDISSVPTEKFKMNFRNLRNYASVFLIVIAAIMCGVIAASGTSFGMDELIPASLKNLKMGASSSSILEMIKTVGTHSLEMSPWDKRKKVVWQIPDNRYYQNITFMFTEKDRLYLVRFTLTKEARSELRNVRQALIEQFGISSEEPGRFRIQDHDILAYESTKKEYTLLEFTDTNTSDRFFELYSRDISLEDKAKKVGNKSDPPK